MPLPSSGTLAMSDINAEFGRGNDLNSYRGTTYYTSSAGPFTFPSGTIAFSDFYGTQLNSPASVNITDQSCINLTKAGIGGTASATYRLANSGQASRQQGSGLVSISGQWLVSGSVSLFEVRGTDLGGGGTFTTPGSGWLSLSTTRDWTLTVTNNYETHSLLVEIRLASSGVVLDSATIDFEVDSAP